MVKIKSIFDLYLNAFPDESERLAQLRELIKNSQNIDNLVSRKNFVGHITASGFVVSRCRTKVLLIHHKNLGFWLSPGGHFQTQDHSPLTVALRKIKEEVSVTSLDYLPYHINDEVPIDIDSHYILENATLNESAHWHHDFRYLFLCDIDEDKVVINKEKFFDYKWSDINELLRTQTFLKLREKIGRALSSEFRPKVFFDRLIKHLDLRQQISTIVVTHLLPDVQVYLHALNKISSVIRIIPKPKSIVPSVYETIKSHFLIENADRQKIQTTNFLAELIESSEQNVVLFDIGGYFAPILNNLVELFPNKLLGVIEDTENGHQKYENADVIPVPVYSVARSPLKANEDFLVGQSVLFSADAILREVGKLIQYLNCSILGFGKIGSSIAHHLLLRGVKPNVFDTDPLRRLAAYNLLCPIPDKKHIIRNSDVIFCATGSRVLNIHDFRELKPGCVVFSVTSSDDEMNLTYLNSEYQIEEIAQHVTRYSSFSNHFYLVNKGNAVNFLHKAVLGDFIHLVRGEMIYALKILVTKTPDPGIYELTEKDRYDIADIWLKTFVDEPARYTDLSLGRV